MHETILGFLGAQFLRLLHFSLRWEKEELYVDGKHWTYGEPVILAFWHSDQLMAPWSYCNKRAYRDKHDSRNKGVPQHPLQVLISEHSDGRIIAEVMRFLSIGNIPGSSTRGGVKALVQMKSAIMKEGYHIAITPDGPKGPPCQVKPGIIALSAKTGAPILPIALAYEHAWRARSWDNMLIPKPFSRARLVSGDLLKVPSGLNNEGIQQYCSRLAEELSRAKDEAEKPFLSEKLSSVSGKEKSHLLHDGKGKNSDDGYLKS